MDADGGNVRRVFKGKIEAGRDSTLPGRPIANSLLTSAWTGTLSRAVSILGRLEKKMPNSSRITSAPVWSPDGSEIASSEHHALGARLMFINVRTREEEQPLPDEALLFQFEIRPGPLRGTDLPLLGTSIRCRSSWIGSCTAYGRTNRRSTSSIATAPVFGCLLMKQVPMQSFLCYRRMARKWFIHRDPKFSKLMSTMGFGHC